MSPKLRDVKNALSHSGSTDNVAMLPFSPGQKLRVAREQAGLSQAEVAEKLFLHVGFVAHLENDAFDLLPGATFIKGYIKSYCRVLGIKPEPLIALFNELEIDVDEPSSTTGQVNTPVKPINGFKVKRSVDDIPPFKERRTA
ncbi:MAG: helix-turn-helix transcriptional regulator, partial [Gammaproteobacteria bacterium]